MMTGNHTQNSTSFEAKNCNIVINDLDNSPISQALTDYLTSIHSLTKVADFSAETIQDNLYYQRIHYYLELPKGFSEKLLNGEHDTLYTYSMRADSAAGYFVTQQINSYVKTLYLYTEGGFLEQDAISSAKKALQSGNATSMVSYEEESDTQNTGLMAYYQYLAYTILMILCSLIPPIMNTIKNKDVEARMSISKLPETKKNMCFSIACASFCFLIWLLFIVVSIAAFGPAAIFSKTGGLYVLNSLVFGLIAITISLIVGSFRLNENVISLIANIVALGMAFLCGVFVPQNYLGSNVLSASKFLPAYWYVKNVNMLAGSCGEVFSESSYWNHLGIEALFLAALFCVYLVVVRRKRA